MPKNAFYAQSGGPTAVINATASGLITAARRHTDQIGTVYAGRYGIIGALKEELVDTSLESDDAIEALKYTPGAAFGSCRYKLKNIDQDDSEYRRLIEVFAAHDIEYFFYNGGNDSQDTTHKVSQLCQKLGYPLKCIGIPKTIDNDLPITDCCPGFGSTAKYVATSVKETARDLHSMFVSSTKVFILEVMGRHAGWIASAAGLAKNGNDAMPLIILFPEIPFNHKQFLKRLETLVKERGYCIVVVSEGVRDTDGKFLHETNMVDAFGHEQLGGVAPVVSRLIKHKLGYKNHWAVADYMQRSARHLASQTDFEHAYALGEAAITAALKGENSIMLTIDRKSSEPYLWEVGHAPLEKVANVEHKMPRDFISEDGFDITAKCKEYLLPLIQGESFPPFEEGLPKHVELKNQLAAKKLNTVFETA